MDEQLCVGVQEEPVADVKADEGSQPGAVGDEEFELWGAAF